MSDDDPQGWFSEAESSNSAEHTEEYSGDRHLEAVSSEDTGSAAWFDSADPPPVAAPDQGASASEAGGRRTGWLFVGTVAALVAVVGALSLAAASVFGGGEDSEAAPLAVPPSMSSSMEEPPTVAASEPKCEASETATVVTGSGEGDTDSVAGVALAFQHAYYVERDAERIKPLLAKDSEITDLHALQEGIDTVDRGTTHCLRIVPEKDGTAKVDVTETAPDGVETVYHQRITTTRESGAVQLVTIESLEGAEE